MTPKSLVVLIATAFLAIVGLSSAWGEVVSATTIPVGFIKVTIPAAADATTPANAVISMPFYRAPMSFGSIASVDGASSFSITGANWTANQFTATPHFVRIKTGAHTGRFFQIAVHTSNQLTVNTGGYSFVSGTPATATELQLLPANAEVVPAHTLGSLFGTSTVQFQTGASASVADSVIIWNGNLWEVYFHSGTSWRKTGSFLNANNAVVRPDYALFIIRRATSPLDLVLMGTVPSTTERSDIRGQASVFLGQRFPLDATLTGLGLQLLPGWLAGDSASAADTASMWIGSTWKTFYYDGTHWRAAGSFVEADTQPVPAGAGLFITRQSSAAGNAATLAQPMPYSLQP